MMTKTFALLTIAAALFAASVTGDAPANTNTQEEQIDCEYVITPQGSTLIKGGDQC
jgi:hypothetical protein